MRSLFAPSISASEKRLPSICRMTPGPLDLRRGIDDAGDHAVDRQMVGDRRRRDRRSRSRVPSCGPPCLKKYHQGMPFCAVSTSVSRPEDRGDVGGDGAT